MASEITERRAAARGTTRRQAVLTLAAGALCGGCGGAGEAGVTDEPLGGRAPVEEPPVVEASCGSGQVLGGAVVLGPAAAEVPLYGSVAVVVQGTTLRVGRDEEGLFAVDPRCTHAGCQTLLTKAGLWECPCHNSRYTYRGVRIDGPAPRSLARYAVCKRPDGTTLIDTKG